MTRRLVTSNGLIAQESLGYQVAVDGVVKPIKSAFVAKGGIVRQYWPVPPGPFPVPCPRNQWSTTPITVYEEVADPDDAFASLVFTRATGLVTYDNFPDDDISFEYTSPPLDGTPGDDEILLIRVDQVSGTALTGTLGTWIDMNSAATLTWSLDRLTEGVNNAVAQVKIGCDDGFGVPIVGSQIAKEVTFIASVGPTGTKVVWSTFPRDLVEIKEAENADCILTFNPSGYAVGDADTSGAFTDPWHEDQPVVTDPENFTVNCTLVSGTAPTGSALATNLDLDVVRSWTLLATSGQDLVCELNVTVSDGVESVTKRVTMHSQYVLPPSSNVWTRIPHFIIEDPIASGTAGGTITMSNDGIGYGYKLTGPTLEEQEDWNSQAPTPTDPENYEVALVWISGVKNYWTGDVISFTGTPIWLSLDTTRSWTWTRPGSVYLEAVFDIWVRRIGEAGIDKRSFILAGIEAPGL